MIQAACVFVMSPWWDERMDTIMKRHRHTPEQAVRKIREKIVVGLMLDGGFGLLSLTADFRFPKLGWRSGRPRLESWHNGFAARASVSWKPASLSMAEMCT